MMKLRLTAATRLSRDQFWQGSLLGRSLLQFPDVLLPELDIHYDNAAPAVGLPAIYNRAIAACPDDTALLLVHDDVFLHDVFLRHRLSRAFQRHQIVGVAGAVLADRDQPSWALEFDLHTMTPLGWQKNTAFSGAVSHHLTPSTAAGAPPLELSVYGPMPASCNRLDGVFLAVLPRALEAAGVRFDERFDFHLYDTDFCRSAVEAGLLLTTWPILITHGSGGNFASEAFKAAARTYLSKWNVRDFSRSIGALP